MTRGPSEKTEKTVTRQDLEAILDSLVEGIVSLDDQGQVIGVNRAACEILEIQKHDALGRQCHGLFGEQFCTAANRVREAVRRRRSVDNVTSQLHTLSGRKKLLALRTTVLRDGDNQPCGNVVVLRDVSELAALREDLTRRYCLHNIVGKSKPMQAVFRLVEDVADSDATVLVEGESGTGKELVARAIHHLSHRAPGPFVAVNCSALAEGVLESELFGHVRGAFTGAVRAKRGRFEAAAGGTIFLDEIGDLAPGIQVKLLRVLQERVIEPVGGEQSIPVDIRVIAATNRSLAGLVAQGAFRQDLYYRLRVVPIHLPPMRERRDDLPLLLQHFVGRFREETGRPIEGVNHEAAALMLDYPWPGNVRELENAVEYAFVKARSGEIGPRHLPPEITQRALGDAVSQHRADPAHDPCPAPKCNRGGQLEATLVAAGWNVARAARRLGVSRTTLYKRIGELGLTRPSE